MSSSVKRSVPHTTSPVLQVKLIKRDNRLIWVENFNIPGEWSGDGGGGQKIFQMSFISKLPSPNEAVRTSTVSHQIMCIHELFCVAVARRCVPTFVNVQEQFEDVFNFTTSEGIQDTATANGFGDLFLNLSVSDLVDGTL